MARLTKKETREISGYLNAGLDSGEGGTPFDDALMETMDELGLDTDVPGESLVADPEGGESTLPEFARLFWAKAVEAVLAAAGGQD